ncbi:MAG: cupin domain-containing protein [Tepidisphaeraceae bacterium]
MQLLKLEDMTPREVFPGHRARFVHADHMTVAHWRIDAGSTVPEHDHPHEQVVNVIAGRYELTVAGKPLALEAGMVVVIPGGVHHSGRAITDATLLDVFYPCREDYR